MAREVKLKTSANKEIKTKKSINKILEAIIEIVGTPSLIMLFSVPIVFILEIIFDSELIDYIAMAFFIASMIGAVIVTIAVIIFMIFGDGIDGEKVPAETYEVPYKNFEEVYELFRDKLEGYTCGKTKEFGMGYSYIFFKEKKKRKDIYILSHCEEYTLDKRKVFNEKVVTYLDNNLIDKTREFHLYVTSLICVDKMTNTFKEDMNTAIFQAYNFGCLNTGLCFKTKKIYISKHSKNSPYKYSWKQLRKEFKWLMEVE